ARGRRPVLGGGLAPAGRPRTPTGAAVPATAPGTRARGAERRERRPPRPHRRPAPAPARRPGTPGPAGPGAVTGSRLPDRRRRAESRPPWVGAPGRGPPAPGGPEAGADQRGRGQPLRAPGTEHGGRTESGRGNGPEHRPGRGPGGGGGGGGAYGGRELRVVRRGGSGSGGPVSAGRRPARDCGHGRDPARCVPVPPGRRAPRPPHLAGAARAASTAPADRAVRESLAAPRRGDRAG